MVEILRSKQSEKHLKSLYFLFVGEWQDFEGFKEEKHGIPIPTPLLAVDEDELLGGLAFTTHARPEATEAGLWINALLVRPQFRRQGIASLLVRTAETLARERGFNELFALTEIPLLYEKLHWSTLSQEGSDAVVHKTLTG